MVNVALTMFMNVVNDSGEGGFQIQGVNVENQRYKRTEIQNRWVTDERDSSMGLTMAGRGEEMDSRQLGFRGDLKGSRKWRWKW